MLDPVKCARYYKHRMDALVKLCLLRCHEIVGKVTDYFYVDEFQKRGTPHRHMCVYVEGAPPADVSTANGRRAMTDWFDKIASCDAALLPEHLRKKVQKHFCSDNYCRNNKSKCCRFNAPWWPMPRSMILQPFGDGELGDDRTSELKHLRTKFREELGKLDTALHRRKIIEADHHRASTTAEQFLSHLGCSFKQYVEVLRTDLAKGRPAVLLKRAVKDLRTNPFVATLSHVWDAQMDVQLVLDPYAAALYLTTYMCKGTEGVSALMSDVIQKFHSGEFDDYRRILKQGEVWLKHNEVCAQEAVFHVLSMSIAGESCAVQYLDTSRPDDRVGIVKNHTNIRELPDDSTDITKMSPLDHFQQYHAERHSGIADGICPDLSYAEFHMLYERESAPKTDTPDPGMLSDEEQDDDSPVDAAPQAAPPQHVVGDAAPDVACLSGLDRLTQFVRYDAFFNNQPPKIGSPQHRYRRRTRRGCIRARWFSADRPASVEDHDREQLMLMLPGSLWAAYDTNTDTEMTRLMLGCQSHRDVIRKRPQFFARAWRYIEAPDCADMEALEKKVIEDLRSADQLEQDVAARLPVDDGNDDLVLDDAAMHAFDDTHPPPATHEVTRPARRSVTTSTTLPHLVADEEHWRNVRALNREQREVHDHCLHHWRHNHTEPMRLFITGGAGVGKSALLRVLFQTTKNVSNDRLQDGRPEAPKAVIMAMTGNTARNVRGMTVHSALRLKITDPDAGPGAKAIK